MAIPMSELSRRMQRFEPSRAVTEILKLAERPDVLSLAGGLPDPGVFSLDQVRESMDRVLRDEGAVALNYGPNPGYSKLREWIAERMADKEGLSLTAEHILVTTGGVDGLNLAAMAMLDEGDVVLVEAPTYMVGLHVFRTYGARIVPVAVDKGGLDADALESKLVELDDHGVRPRLLYTIPTFQNPSGLTMDLERRKTIVALCRRFGVRIVEDHAYAELTYDEPPTPSLKSLDPDNVLLIHTFSKIFGPGVRLGWVAAEPPLIEQLGLCKLGTDQCSNTLTQRLVLDFGSRGLIDEQVARSIRLYRAKRDQMESAMKKHFPAGVSWEHPGGGFFIWIRLPQGVDSDALLTRAIEEHKTAFVAGPCFFVDGATSGANYLRLSFSYVPEGQIEEAIRRVSRTFGADRSWPSAAGKQPDAVS